MLEARQLSRADLVNNASYPRVCEYVGDCKGNSLRSPNMVDKLVC